MLRTVSLVVAVAALSSIARAEAPAPADLEALLKRTTAIDGGAYKQNLEQTIRKLKDVNAQHAAASYVLAICDGDTKAFSNMVPDGGIVLEDRIHKKKSKLTRDKVAAQAAALDQYKRPSFLGVMGDAAELEPAKSSWSAEITKKNGLEISANGANAWATLKKQPDGTWRIASITLSQNDD
jgi:hypothetical protein